MLLCICQNLKGNTGYIYCKMKSSYTHLKMAKLRSVWPYWWTHFKNNFWICLQNHNKFSYYINWKQTYKTCCAVTVEFHFIVNNLELLWYYNCNTTVTISFYLHNLERSAAFPGTFTKTIPGWVISPPAVWTVLVAKYRHQAKCHVPCMTKRYFHLFMLMTSKQYYVTMHQERVHQDFSKRRDSEIFFKERFCKKN